MKFRVLIVASALLVLAGLAFGQDPAQVWYGYPGDFDCANRDPLTYGECWTGTPIPDGADAVYVFINGVETCGPYPMNGGVECGYEGFFFMMNYCVCLEGDETYVEVRYDDCVYRSQTYTLPAGATEIYLIESDWVSCQCETPGCEVIEEYSGLLQQDRDLPEK
jgi:hypothetical protein